MRPDAATASRRPSRNRELAYQAVRSVHTVAFVVIAGSIVTVFADGLLGRPRRRTVVAGAIAGVECAVFAGNGFVCPLTPLAERLGDGRRGAVTDIFLPGIAARNLTWVGSSVLAIGVVLNVRALYCPVNERVR